MNNFNWLNELREFLGIPRQLSDIRQSINQHGNAIRTAYERYHQESDEQWRRIEVRLANDNIGKKEPDQESHDRVQKSIKRAAWCTFWAAFIYAGITLLLWLNSRDQLEMEQRGWVVFDSNYVDTMVLGPNNANISVPIRLLNIGKTPVRTVDGFVTVEETEKGGVPAFNRHRDYITPIRVGLIYPGTEFAHTTDIDEFAERRKNVLVTETKRRQFKNGDIVFNVWGRLTYVDIFRHEHFVQFCHAVSETPIGKTKECVDYNLIDNHSKWESLRELFRR